MNKESILDEVITERETSLDDFEIDYINRDGIKLALSQMEQNLFEQQSERFSKKVKANTDYLLKKLHGELREIEIACGSMNLMLMGWVTILGKKKKEATITSLRRWYKANAHRTEKDIKEEISKITSKSMDEVHKLLEWNS